jgi:hypothetical protein
MPMLVTKTYICDTDDVDEAYEWTKPMNDKIATFQVGQIRPFDPNAPAQPPGPMAAQHVQNRPKVVSPTPKQ